MFVRVFVILLIFGLQEHVNTFRIDLLHQLMTDSELAYYFNNENKNFVPDYEVIYLPTIFPVREAVSEGDESFATDFHFTAFGRPISLRLKPNENLVSPNFKTYIQHGHQEFELLPYSQKQCHFLHRDKLSAAAVSICQPNSVQGLLFLDNSTLEIHPLSPRLHSVLKLREPLLYDSENEKIPHIVRRATFLPNDFTSGSISLAEDFLFPTPNMLDDDFSDEYRFDKRNFLNVEAASHRPVDALTAELALFFDAEAYRIFAPYFNYDDGKLRDMVLAYMNGIQALYHHPSLGTNLELVLVRLDIMKKQPSAMPHYDGERSKLLDSFCDYQRSLNPTDDENPNHWDMALYVSGLDFFHYENGKKSGVTMGLATVGGVCLPQYACVIAEMGTTNMFGKPYPSAGFTSVYILAHEIGHNLGMHHDSTKNNCPKEGYIMSPSRGVSGETQWSSCSAEVMSKLSRAKCLHDSAKVPPSSLDHSRFLDTPGRIYTAKKQCEILLRDKDAVVSPNQPISKICYSMECKTPHRSGFYFAGPALEGTECGKGKYCFGGECVSKVFPTPVPTIPGGWGPWKPESCNSGCLEKSKGYQAQRRLCNNPPPVNTDKGCEGSSYGVALCSDDKICRKISRKSTVDYASAKCKEFSKLLPQLDPKGAGLQAPHEDTRIWMGCSIFCRRKDSGSYYTPRVELNDLGVSPYFPDGTWCHTSKTGENYYCLQHHCLPESFEFSKSPKNSQHFLHGIGEDIPVSQNARPNEEIAHGLQQYLSVGLDGKPLQTVLKPGQVKPLRDEDWETKDYVELPDDKLNEIFKNDNQKESSVFDFIE